MSVRRRAATAVYLERGETCGNRFVILDLRDTVAPGMDTLRAISRAAAEGTDGADDLLVIVRPDTPVNGLPAEGASTADARLFVVGADGRLADICGNGLLYVASVLAESPGWRARSETHDVLVESLRGLHRARREGAVWNADLEWPRADSDEARHLAGGLGVRAAALAVVDTGEPHAVVTAEAVGVRDPLEFPSAPLQRLAARVHGLSRVPGGVNVTFAAGGAGGDLCARTFERGVLRLTESCGTGAAAAAWVFAEKALHAGAVLSVHAPGGTHRVSLREKRIRIAAAPRRIMRRPIAELLGDERESAQLRAALERLLAELAAPACERHSMDA